MSEEYNIKGLPVQVDGSDERVTHVCQICPRGCRLKEGQVGVCGARGVLEGRLRDLNYGQCTSLALDPIEKKPFAQFMPGSLILSYGSFGCNLSCPFCQNDSISFERLTHAGDTSPLVHEELAPEYLVDIALSTRPQGNVGIAFTYNEPFVGYEFMMDTARLAKQAGLLTAAITNGFVSADAWDKALTCLDALNIDLKAFTQEGYATLKGDLDTVKRNIAAAHEAGVHVEVTTLLVPRLNDSLEELEAECAWLASLSPDIPLHLSRYFPHHDWHEAPTNLQLMHDAREVANRHLKTVLLGNVF